MGIAVNGIDISDREIEAELPHHQGAANPLKSSVHELVLRSVLLQEAQRLGLPGEDEDDRIEALFDQEVKVPEADEEACLRYYEAQRQRFMRGELVEARHIMFQVAPNAPLELLRDTAGAILEELKERPERFAELATQYSNCPSGAIGGSLGQLGRGQTVPEFDSLLFRLAPGELHGRLLETRFGLHIVQVMRRIDGYLLPYETVRAQIADELSRQSWQRALHQYLQILVGKAQIEGITLEGVASPLVQ
ncbi:peptidylprolyl isomerase [Pseudoduganella violacea]|uniref:peptidylprolyl isomerase n=1 Tax=Pseudoduganella violacea TaxID=1715466 RepID=A0A7W5BD23_9BURK|nr:peptidylprolyl isomerase [Pseudoduganella violacea]MBB3120708.1 peptidyl-prolyl cis-trans isomerase C [Pseudoduganella violacea]